MPDSVQTKKKGLITFLNNQISVSNTQHARTRIYICTQRCKVKVLENMSKTNTAKCKKFHFLHLYFFNYHNYFLFLFFSKPHFGFILDNFQKEWTDIPDTKINSISKQWVHSQLKIIAKCSQEKSARIFLSQAEKIFLPHLFLEMSESFWLKFCVLFLTVTDELQIW